MPIWMDAQKVGVESSVVKQAERQPVLHGGLAKLVAIRADVGRVEKGLMR